MLPEDGGIVPSLMDVVKIESPTLDFSKEEDEYSAFNFNDAQSETTVDASIFDEKNAIVAHEACCWWDKQKPPILKNLNFRIPQGEMTMIIGSISCGKSTLLRAFLRELPLITGFSGSEFEEIAYCAQSPWLTNGSLKENIISNSEFDPQWFRAVVHACALIPDLKQLPLHEQTVIGSKGLSLSGGQQMRVVGFFPQCTLNAKAE